MSARGYPAEFRAEAVRLYRSVKGERSLRSISEELGISIETLRSWVKQAEIDEGSRDGLTTEEGKRLRFLERENRILKEERELLKKAPRERVNSTSMTRLTSERRGARECPRGSGLS